MIAHFKEEPVKSEEIYEIIKRFVPFSLYHKILEDNII
jgi:hypothetical protein